MKIRGFHTTRYRMESSIWILQRGRQQVKIVSNRGCCSRQSQVAKPCAEGQHRYVLQKAASTWAHCYFCRPSCRDQQLPGAAWL
jgi:hypothetical protein